MVQDLNEPSEFITQQNAENAISELQLVASAAVGALLGGEQAREGGPWPGLCACLWVDRRPSAVRSSGERDVVGGFPYASLKPQSYLGAALLAQAATPRRVDLAIDLLRAIWRVRVRRQKAGAAPPGADAQAEAVIISAYSDMWFRSETAIRVYRYLKSRVLLYPDGAPTPMLAAASIHALVLARGLPESLPLQVKQCLHAVGREMAEAPGWAGFWDLWFLRSVRERPGLTLLVELGGLAGLAESLATGENQMVEPTELPDPIQMRAGWRAGIPAYSRSVMNETC